MESLMQHLLEEKKISKKTFLVYTILFAVLSLAVYGYLFVTGTSFIWEGDGLSQHYPIFVDYIGKLKEFIFHPSNGFPLWDWTIGLGADVLFSYGYYVVGDPFVYLGLLFPPEQMELAFHLLILLRVYCIGAAFLLFCRKMDIKSSGALAGAIMYTYAHYVVLNVARHPFFLNPVILLPLLCLGVEKILRKESNTFFVVIVFISAFSNFYFFYMLALLTILFAVARYLHLYGFGSLKQVAGFAWTALYAAVMGLLMAGVLFVPMVWGFLQGSREPGEFAAGMLVYPLEFYVSLFRNFLVAESYLWAAFGFSAFTVLLLPLLFTKHRRFGYISYLLIFFAVMILLPAFASVMNGFSGPYNRWSFAIPLFLSLGSAMLYNHRFRLTQKEINVMGFSILFFIIATFGIIRVAGFDWAFVVPLLFAGAMWSMLILCVRQEQTHKQANKQKRSYTAILLILIMGNMVYLSYDHFHPSAQNFVSVLIDYGTADETIQNTFGGLEESLPETEEIYRMGITARDSHVRNQTILLDRMGMTQYLSITNGNIARFARQLEMGQFQIIQPVRNGFDDRRIANHLLGVRYILTEAANEAYLPYGYEVIERTEENGVSYIAAETENAYPFAYVNPVYMTEEAFAELNPVEREAYLSYGVTVNSEEVTTDELISFDGSLNVQEAAFSLASDDTNAITIEEDEWIVHEKDGTATLTLNNPEQLENAEVYVYLEGLQFTPESNESWRREPINYTARVSLGDRRKSIYQSDILRFSSYFHRNQMLFNMGYQTAEGVDETISLQLSETGRYQIEDITVFILPLDENYDERVEQKWDRQLEIETIEDENISGTVTSDQAGILTTSIPYSIGWKAHVNGEELETIRVNAGFVGIPLEAGEMDVTLTYRTPFLFTGLTATVIGSILFVLNYMRQRKR